MPEIEIPSLLFDSEWYLRTYPDVAEANVDPMNHYLLFGYKEGRNPNRFFDTNFYLRSYPDIAASTINPFIHYIMHGAKEGRFPRLPGKSPADFPVMTKVLSDRPQKTTMQSEIDKKIKSVQNTIQPFKKHSPIKSKVQNSRKKEGV